jgi:hypothetical protein
MASTTQAPAPILDVPVVKENFNRALVEYDSGKKDEAGNAVIVRDVLPEDDAKEAEAKKEVTILHIQTFAYPRVNTFEGFQEVFRENEREGCKLATNGLKTKAQNRAKALLLATNDDGEFTFPTDQDVYDLTSVVAAESATRGTSLTDKVKKMLEGMTPEQRSQIEAFMALQQGGSEV